ncbi:hypothetical protein CDL12_14525 [Handroanthus impetiginosus]|uniref:F-box domain-containing protein n=1 Tax=Handroanthus impetiginosus TaxID=429701 RepID=A0A2G9H5S9_9LAMI|nr:hypothetical protein CDL12_19651 [Handroanthus impetiginosus]PIN12872.1 hypothetical protein CDL12_14525 [Handroanthus impetiginosus]
METQATAIPKLPNDVVIEILTRLPVKSLLRFKCVCKSWLSLISSQEFAKSHLRNSKKSSNFTHHRIMLNYRGNLKQCSVQSLFYEPISDAFDTDYYHYSVRDSRNFVWVVGSCDGLICLAINKKDLILWNPSTRISKKLPDFAVKINFGSYFAYGLGFDKSSNDYKVVGFFNNNRDLSEVIVKIYSLKNDEWKRIKNFKGRWLMDDPATFANGKLHWISNSDLELKSGWDIVSLDLETEEYGILEMPAYVKSGFYSRLGASEGSLYVLCSHLSNAEVWIMDDCNQSWNKVVTIPYIDDFLKYTYKRALYVLKNGEVLLLCGSKFVIFDSRDCSFRYPEIRNSGEVITASTYLESLVSPLL